MKTFLLVIPCLLLIGCANLNPGPRWAVANKREIESAIYQWGHDKMEEAKKSENLSPQTEEQLRQFEALQSEFMRKQMETRMRGPMHVPNASAPMSDKDFEDLSNRVAVAKAPIADILVRRARQEEQFRAPFTADKLIAEYVKSQDRFDLIVDSSDSFASRSVIIYQKTGEMVDITPGVMKLLKEKTGP